MKKFALAAAAAVLMVSGFAYASTPVHIEGASAQNLFDSMNGGDQIEILENSICITSLKKLNAVCTLEGSHESCHGMPVKYSCDIQAD